LFLNLCLPPPVARNLRSLEWIARVLTSRDGFSTMGSHFMMENWWHPWGRGIGGGFCGGVDQVRYCFWFWCSSVSMENWEKSFPTAKEIHVIVLQAKIKMVTSLRQRSYKTKREHASHVFNYLYWNYIFSIEIVYSHLLTNLFFLTFIQIS
jgi:hypothetical protein